MAPEHKLLGELMNNITNYKEVADYKVKTSYRSEFDRISDQKEKTGCLVEGIYAINPVNKKRVPVKELLGS